jgi:heme/copper-type cytochrome/quinol oxidase subunit 3
MPEAQLDWLILGAIFLILVFGYHRYLDHKKDMRKMDLIEKRLWKPEYEMLELKEVALLIGLIIAAVGFAILLGSLFIVWENVGWLRLGGFITLCIGIAFIIFHATIRKKPTQVT